MKTRKAKAKLPKDSHLNPELNKYADVILFPEKLKKANDILRTVGVPKI
ncbi:MAG: hypothetical protein V4649_17990 [Bacteroidota bacterium]